MKLFIALLFIISLSFNQYAFGQQDGTCQTCLPKGEKCNYLKTQGANFVIYGSLGVCRDNTICGPASLTGNVTDQTAWVCRDRVGQGESCYYKNDGSDMVSSFCDLGLLCDKTSSKCIDSRFANIGEPCKQQSDCAFIDATCTNSVCTNNSTTCEGDDECSYGNYCADDSTCTPKVGEGADCSSARCIDGLVCDDEYSKTCKKGGFLKLGQKCDDNDIKCDYNDNLYCNYQTNVCEAYVINNPSGNCSLTKDSCGVNARCYCGDGKCYGIGFAPSDYSEMVDPLFTCMTKNKCSFSGNILSKSSCVSKNCPTLFCEYLSMGTKGIYADKCGTSYGSCSSNSSLSKFNFSILSILLILIITILII